MYSMLHQGSCIQVLISHKSKLLVGDEKNRDRKLYVDVPHDINVPHNHVHLNCSKIFYHNYDSTNIFKTYNDLICKIYISVILVN